ncbi:MAG TPA: DUF4265 domain-containing protein [Fimbriimonadaceae bacterium]|nr:DUF4265 domain-containing protein [Fimbriimonadaceae bacterium]
MDIEALTTIIHANPYWGSRADNVVFQAIPDDNAMEELTARFISPNTYEICCIPFISYNLALGDLVFVNDRKEIESVLVRSGRWVFRAWFENGVLDAEAFESNINFQGGNCEWYSRQLVAIDAEDHSVAEPIANYLQMLEDARSLVYETGKT